MSDEVAARIRAAIEDHGPIGFDEYMELALYSPAGFFHDHPVGADKHFVTSPHAQPFVFAHCVRGALLETWGALGEPDLLTVVEAGAGDGTLASALLESFTALEGGPTVEYTAVEIGTGAAARLANMGLRVSEGLGDLAPFEGVVVANELLDNLPFALAQSSGPDAAEIRIGHEGGRFVEVTVPWARPLPRGLAPTIADERRTTIPFGAIRFVEALAASMRRGAALLIDYGVADGPTGGAHGYRDQRETSDVLSAPGTTDITAGVDLSMLAAAADASGLVVHGPVPQAAALDALGYGRWAETMREMRSMLQRAGRHAEATRVWGARSQASLLVDPAGWGRLWWLVLSTPDLPRPAWIGEALEQGR